MRERKLKAVKTAILICPFCSKKSRLKVPADGTFHAFECKKCESKIETPPAKCCIICAYTNKKCTPAVQLHNNLIQIRRSRKKRRI
jgi:hypothetical protein